MATSPEKIQVPVRSETEESKTTTVTVKPQKEETVPPEVRDKLVKCLASILTKAQELGFEIATTENEEILRHPIVRKAREIIKELKALIDIQKQLARRS